MVALLATIRWENTRGTGSRERDLVERHLVSALDGILTSATLLPLLPLRAAPCNPPRAVADVPVIRAHAPASPRYLGDTQGDANDASPALMQIATITMRRMHHELIPRISPGIVEICVIAAAGRTPENRRIGPIPRRRFSPFLSAGSDLFFDPSRPEKIAPWASFEEVVRKMDRTSGFLEVVRNGGIAHLKLPILSGMGGSHLQKLCFRS